MYMLKYGWGEASYIVISPSVSSQFSSIGCLILLPAHPLKASPLLLVAGGEEEEAGLPAEDFFGEPGERLFPVPAGTVPRMRRASYTVSMRPAWIYSWHAAGRCVWKVKKKKIEKWRWFNKGKQNEVLS